LFLKSRIAGRRVCPSNLLPVKTSKERGNPSSSTIRPIKICGWLNLPSLEKPHFLRASSSKTSK